MHPEWRVAIDKELKGLSDLKSYVLVDRPKDVKVISSHLILDEKPDGTKKARLVARGDEQVYGESYTATWAPTISAKSLRFLCSIAAKHNVKIRVSDANQAFLNAPLKERIFIRPPPHLETKGKVWLMKKALYGLKQAGREWYHMYRDLLVEFGFKVSSFDPCLFHMKDKGKLCLVGVHVDDSLLVFQDQNRCKELIRFLGTKIKIKDLGEIKHALGIDFVVDADGVSLSQKKYVESILETLGFENSNPVPTPASTEDPVATKLSETLLAHSLQKIVGMLLWLSVMTRPDIAYSVAKLAQEVSKPSPVAYARAARILRYIRGTKDVGISYSNKQGRGKMMHAYVDADWAGDLDRYSQSGYVFMYQGGPVSWLSKKQPTIALSSTEAEIIAATGCVQEAAWYQGSGIRN